MWSGADFLIRQGIQFCTSIVLARLLTPEEFGTNALLSIFTGIATAFVDSGFSSALIQRQNTSSTDESTVFWFNLTHHDFGSRCLGTYLLTKNVRAVIPAWIAGIQLPWMAITKQTTD